MILSSWVLLLHMARCVLPAGTTTATVLARAILNEGCKSVAAGMNPMDLRRGINLAVDNVLTVGSIRCCRSWGQAVRGGCRTQRDRRQPAGLPSCILDRQHQARQLWAGTRDRAEE
jgi:hypothetical protein